MEHEAQIKYAGFWKRVWAAILDSIIVGAGTAVIMGAAGINEYGRWGHDNPSRGLVALAVAWLYAALMESGAHQATVGKMALGLRVTDEAGKRVSFGRATGRHFAKIISALPILIGFMMAGWTKKKQALHDIIAGTLVIRK